MQDLYTENYKTSLKTVKAYPNESRDTPRSWVGILNIVNGSSSNRSLFNPNQN